MKPVSLFFLIKWQRHPSCSSPRGWSHVTHYDHMVVEEAVLGPACYFSPSIQWVPGFLLWRTAIKRCKPQHITWHILSCTALNLTCAGHIQGIFLLSKIMLSYKGRACRLNQQMFQEWFNSALPYVYCKIFFMRMASLCKTLKM